MSNLPEPRDDALLKQVESLLLDGKRSGNPVLDDLSGSVPQARPAFQQQLEDKLVAHLENNTSGRSYMPVFSQKRKRQPVRYKLGAVAAALAAVLIGGGILFGMAVHEPVPLADEAAVSNLGCITPTWTAYHKVQENDTISGIAHLYNISGGELIQQNCLRPAILYNGMMLRVPAVTDDIAAQLTAVAVATPVFPQPPTLPAIDGSIPADLVVPPVPGTVDIAPMVAAAQESLNQDYLPIVIAAHDIPADTLIMPDMVTRIYLSRETLAALGAEPGTPLSMDNILPPTPTGYYGNLEDVLWQRTIGAIPRWQPVKSGLLSGAAGKTVGIVIGFNDSAGLSCGTGIEPVKVNEGVAQQLREILKARGYSVEMMYTNSPRLNKDLNVDMLLALFTDGCPQDTRYNTDGFLPVQAYPTASDTNPAEVPNMAMREKLMQCVVDSYADSTGLQQRTFRTLDNTLVYPFVAQIDARIPSLILRMGSLATNSAVLLNRETNMAVGLANGIDCYTGASGDIPAALPSDKVALFIPLNALNTIAGTIKQGDTVNIIASLAFVNTEAGDFQMAVTPADDTRSVVRTIVKDVKVMQVGPTPEKLQPDETPEMGLTLSVSPQDSVVLQWMLDAKVPLTFEIAD